MGVDPSSLSSKSKNPSITGGLGFIFVDSRPISCSRPGPFKSLLSLYKNYIRSSFLTTNPNNPSPPTISDPFIYLNIQCKSPGMYDPNIEPAKDDVLFRDWDRDVLGVVEGMLREVYGELKGKEKGEKERVRKPQGVDEVDFGVLLAKKPALATVTPAAEELPEHGGVGKGGESLKIVEEDTDEFADPELDLYDGATPPVEGNYNHKVADTNRVAPTLPSDPPIATAPHDITNLRLQRQRRPTWGFSMSANLIDEDDAVEEYLPPPPPPLGEEEAARKDISLSNPWVMAKMNAIVKDSSSPMKGVGASSPSVQHTLGGGRGGSSSSTNGGGVGWVGRNLPPGYRVTSTNRNRDAITAFHNGSGSPFPFGQRPGGLDKWILSGVAAIAPESGVVRKSIQQGHGGSSSPIASSSQTRERRVEQIPTVGHVRGAVGVGGDFMTATEFIATTGEDEDEHPQSGRGIRRAGIGFTPVNATSNYHQKFAGVDGPGGVIVRSSGRRERAVHRAREEGNLWPNPLERYPFPQGVSGRDESDESEGDGENIDANLRGEGSPVVKRRRVERGRGKGKGKAKARGSYCGSGGEDEDNDEVLEQDEQLDLLFTHPPLKQQQQKKSALRMAGQKKFVPPLLKPRGGGVAGVGNNEVVGSSDDVDDDMIDINAPQSPPQQLPTRSPHRNRQRTATAALGMAADTVVNNLTRGSALPGPTTAPIPEGEPEQPQSKHMKTRTRVKSRYLLPLERVAPEERMHNTSITVHFSSGLDVVERVVHELGRLNLGEYTADPRRKGVFLMKELRGELVGEVVGEWLRGKVGGEGGESERELVGKMVGWEVEEGSGEGEEEEVKRLVAAWG